MRKALLLVVAVAGCGGSGSHTGPFGDPKFKTSLNPVPGQYLAFFAKGAAQEATDAHTGNEKKVATAICAKYGATLDEVYTGFGILRFASTEARARAMSHDPRLDSVEENATMDLPSAGR